MKRILVILILIGATGCGFLNDLKTTVDDLNLGGKLKSRACELYTTKGRGMAEDAWANDWPVFAPIFQTPADPAADEAFCRKLIVDRKAAIMPKPKGGHAATALSYVVLLPQDFDSKSPQYRASTMCHEAVHIVWQKRVGIALAALEYATISGRITSEGVAYAVDDALTERYGADPKAFAEGRRKRAERFPESYELKRLVDAECIGDFFDAIREELRERAGV